MGSGRRRVWGAGQRGVPTGALELTFGERTFPSMPCLRERQPFEPLNSQLGSWSPDGQERVLGSSSSCGTHPSCNNRHTSHVAAHVTHSTGSRTHAQPHTPHTARRTKAQPHTERHHTHTHTHTHTQFYYCPSFPRPPPQEEPQPWSHLLRGGFPLLCLPPA